MEEGAGAAVVEDGAAAGSAIFFEGRRSQVKERNHRDVELSGRANVGGCRARRSGYARAARAVRCWGGGRDARQRRPAVRDADRGGERIRK